MGVRGWWAGPEAVAGEVHNAQTPLGALDGHLTPAGALFVRSHFGVPEVDPDAWRLRVGGAVERPFELSAAELRGMPLREVEVVLECAGNGRALMDPPTPGVPWGERAVGCARFAGVPFRAVAEWAGPVADAVEWVFTGADGGESAGRPVAFERSLPAAAALTEDVLLATHLNGRPLTPEHGAPVRLVAPGRYGVADVKWLVGARAVTEPFDGPFQGGSYVYRESRGAGGPEDGPVGLLRVKSLITAPVEGEELVPGVEVAVGGHAWSGGGPVRRVEVRVDDGPWADAELTPPAGPYGWADWTYRWTPALAGRHRLTVRASDAGGAVQPLEAPWNADGYGCNPAARIEVVVRGSVGGGAGRAGGGGK